jgi:DNA polymerase-3 subunit delta
LTLSCIAPYYGVVSPAELNKELESGRFRAVYYFFGSEDYRIKEAEKVVVSRFLPKVQQTTNHITLSAQKDSLENIINELSMIPMLGERQVFKINDIQMLSQTQIEKILSLVTPPDPNRVVIVASPSAKAPNKKTKLFKFLSENTAAVEFAKLRGDSASSRIRSMFKKARVEIDPEALRILTELSGGDLGGLVSEVGKLIDYIGEGGTVTKDDVALLSSDYQVYNIFELADRAATGDFDQAMSIIKSMDRSGVKPSSLLFWLGEHFVGLYLAKNRKSFGSGKRDMSWKYQDQFGLFDNYQLEKIINLIARADFDLRSNIKPENVILEKLIYSICSECKKAANA